MNLTLRCTGMYSYRMFFVAFAVFILECQSAESVDLGNVALNKPAAQVSTYIEHGQHWSAKHAVDGNTNCVHPVNGQYYSATDIADKAWWRVDLQNVYNIYRIVVRGNPRNENGQLVGFRLYLTESPTDNPIASTSVYTATTYGNGTFDIPISITARYCLLQNPANSNAIVLCEVEIYANGNPEQYRNLYVFVGNTPMQTTNGTLVYNGNATEGKYTFNIDFHLPMSFRYLIIKRFTRSYMTICEVKFNIEQRYAVTTNQSSIFLGKPDSYNSSKAIDRQMNYSIDSCQCCSVTNSAPSWWQLNLGYRYQVTIVEVFGRESDAPEQIQGAVIHAGNYSMETKLDDVNIFTVTTIDTSIHFKQYLQQPVTAQYFIVSLTSHILTLCEFIVYGTGPVCDTGLFGQGCLYECHCADKKTCDVLSGACQTQDCLPGWQGMACDKACGDGYYGRNCTELCNEHCRGGHSYCNNVNGNCDQGCTDGYLNEKCNKPCTPSKYGANCSHTCSTCKNTNCRNTDGLCSMGCVPGYKPDNLYCNTTCGAGTYGQNCSFHCSTHCREGSTHCDTTNGTCKTGCEKGYLGEWCNSTCEHGRYGFGCNETCHKCKTGTICNFQSGYCLDGCMPGYNGSLCNQDCPNGYFGDCTHSCHCMHNSVCEKTNGSCPNDCDIGWAGSNCSLDLNLVKRISHVSTNQSGIFETYDSSKAIDGNERYDVDHCNCCSVANGAPSSSSWWQIDLGEKYLIYAIRVYGRGDLGSNSQLENSLISVGNVTLTMANASEIQVYQIPTNTNTTVFTTILNESIIAQFIIVRHSTAILTICEFKVYEKVCDIGHFGTGCSHQCHCLDGNHCNSVDGNCQTHGCFPGWRGDSCEQECEARNFGAECNEICHCINQTNCDHVNGTCEKLECDPGWIGESCSTICSFRKFGSGCNSICHCINNSACNNVNGTCDIAECDPGWTGNACNQECDNGRFGPGCKQYCHCINNTACNNVNGICEINQCNPGWIGITCETACGRRTFGAGCNFSCHCTNETTCNNVNGTCEARQCSPGWRGDACDTECVIGKFGQDCNSSCHCINNTVCNNVNGTCSSGRCEPGWLGDACDKVCDRGTFGAGCNCSCHCINETTCNNVNGKCGFRQCSPGWRGDACDTECADGNFGPDCKLFCHCIDNSVCNNVNGTCYSGECDAGWLGEACDKECDIGTFGKNCGSICHCINDTQCDNVNGICQERMCSPGWTKDTCDTGCDIGQFGQGCNSTCHCANDISCDKVNGTCRDEGCAPDWEGPACQIKALHQTGNDKGPSSAGVAGGVGAAVGLLALGVLIAVVVYKRRKAKESPGERSQFSHLDKVLKARHSAKEASDTYAQSNMSFEGEQETSMNNSGEGDYYSFGGPSIGVKVHELWDYIKEKMENKCQQLFAEFKTLPSGLVHPCKSADDITNKGKNRYREMYAYDHTRVILEDVEENVNTDYINACYINGYEKAKKFVASQGPTKTMVDDFWRMVWQLKSDKIVMLTNLTELGAIKCFQYWPKEGVEEEHCFGNVIVNVTGIETSLDYNIRHFEVRKNNERARQIRQFHFKSWPDKDVPDSTWCLANFWRAVDTNAPSKAGPIVVHCSAGIGRTGTFIALDNLVSQAKVEGCVRPLQMVETLRRQRVNMVQTRVVADALLFGTHIVWTKQFGEMFAFLVQKRKGETGAYLEKQFDLIERSATDVTGDAADTAEYSNVETIQSESAAYRPKLRNRGPQFVQELRALYIPNYRKKNTFLVSMSPDKDTIEEFWSLVDDNNIKTIIMLTERSAPCYQSSCELGSSSNNGNRFSVHKIEEKIRKCYTERTFTFKESDREDEDYLTTVKQFEYTAWKDGYIVPGDTRSLLDMIESVTNWQPHLAESQPILIHCRDGCSRSGIVCVLLNELQRMKHEGGHINILESVKLMKKRQKFLIGTYEQYRFCFDLMLAHIKTTEVYENL